MFRRNKKECGVLLDFQIVKNAPASAPYLYKDGFSYYSIRIGFDHMLQL